MIQERLALAPQARRNDLLCGTVPRAIIAGGLLLAAGGLAARLAQRRHLRRPATAIMAAGVLVDSARGHYRGQFHRPAMYAPLVGSALVLATTLTDPSRAPHLRRAVLLGAVATGVVGTGFHLSNLLTRVGGLGIVNLFYGPPLGAPAALSMAGLLGLSEWPAWLVRPRTQLALGALGTAGTVAEVALLHYRGAFHNRYMALPIVVPSLTAAVQAAVAIKPTDRLRRAAARLMGATLLTGMAGVVFHAYGIHRNMGGWGNASQNVMNGPPLGAPPSFTALALSGLTALRDIEETRHAGSVRTAVSGLRRAGQMGQSVLERRHSASRGEAPAPGAAAPLLPRGGVAPAGEHQQPHPAAARARPADPHRPLDR